MNTLDWYIDTAKELHQLKSDRALARELRVSHRAIQQWRENIAFPSEHNMIVLAALAEINAEAALMDLHRWSAQTDIVRKTWEGIAEKLKRAAAAIIATTILGVALAQPANAITTSGNMQTNSQTSTLYIMQIVR